MATKDLIRRMAKSKDVQPKQLTSSTPAVEIDKFETTVMDKVEDLVEKLMVEKELAAPDIELENFNDLKNELKELTTSFNQMRSSYVKVINKYDALSDKVDALLKEINMLRETKKSKWKGLFS